MPCESKNSIIFLGNAIANASGTSPASIAKIPNLKVRGIRQKIRPKANMVAPIYENRASTEETRSIMEHLKNR